MNTSAQMHTAQRWMNEPLRRFFAVEIDNEGEGGVSPSTLSSAIDSLAQAPDDVVETWLDGGTETVLGAVVALLKIRDLIPGDTELRSLL